MEMWLNITSVYGDKTWGFYNMVIQDGSEIPELNGHKWWIFQHAMFDYQRCK